MANQKITELPDAADLSGDEILPLVQDGETVRAPLSELPVSTATSAFLRAAIDTLVGGAPGALDTLNEIAAQLADDESVVAALVTTVAGKTAKAANLSDVTDAAAARTNLGVSAANTPFAPGGGVAATNVQAAIQEVRDEASGRHEIIAGDVGDQYTLDFGGHRRVVLRVDLIDDLVLTLENSVAGESELRLLARQDGTGDWAVQVTDGALDPVQVGVSLGAGTASWVEMCVLSNGEIWVLGSGEATASDPEAPDLTAPAQVIGLNATAGDSEVDLSWLVPDDGGSAITDYIVQYRVAGVGGAWSTFGDGTGTTASTTVTGLTNAAGYDFRVAAVNAIGTGAYSTVHTAIPTAGAPTPFHFYDMSQQTGFANGARMSAWTDFGSGGGDATAAGDARPTFEIDVHNGHPAARFDHATNQSMTLPSLAALTEGHVFVVLKIDADPPPDGGSSGLWNLGGTTEGSLYSFFLDGGIYDAFGSTTRHTVGHPAAPLDAWNIYEVEVAADGSWIARLNGAEITSFVGSIVAFPASPTVGTSGLGTSLQGYIGAFALFDAPLSSGDAAAERAALKATWDTA